MGASAFAVSTLACALSAAAAPAEPPPPSERTSAAPARAGADPAAAAKGESAPRKRPTVAVMDFDYGTLTTHWWGEYDIGRGVATQLVNVLVEDGRLRLIERSKLDAVLGEQDLSASDRVNPDASKLAKMGKVLGVRYIIAGAITKFATSDRKFGGGVGGAVARGVLGPVGGLSFRKAKQEVSLTARLIDTTTAEVVVSAKGDGVAKKGQGVGIEADVGGGGTSFTTESAEFRASGMGEAQERAVQEVARALLSQTAALSAEDPQPEPTPTPVPAVTAARAPRRSAPRHAGGAAAKPPGTPKP
jgi:curli biogenesis system outer membrane secretion channel CsgG